jgi:hypothetical protein
VYPFLLGFVWLALAAIHATFHVRSRCEAFSITSLFAVRQRSSSNVHRKHFGSKDIQRFSMDATQEPDKRNNPGKQSQRIENDEEQAVQRIIMKGNGGAGPGHTTRDHGKKYAAEILHDEEDDDDPPIEVSKEQIQKWRDEDAFGVYDAFDQLERAIALENPDLKLEHAELQDKLKYMGQGKHLLFPMIFKYILMPSIYAWGLYKLSAINKIAKGFVRIMDAHFWACVVAAPMLLLEWKRLVRKEEPLSEDLQRISPEAREILATRYFAKKWETPETSCKDPVFFLLQYWTSAVKGMLFVPVMNILGEALALPASGMAFWTTSTQFLTRIAVLASLYQYPEMLYQLQRANQIRPIGFFPTTMQKMVGIMLHLAPFGLISDFSKILASLSTKFTFPLYTSIFILLYGFWFRAFEAERAWKENPTKRFCEMPPMKTNKKLFYGLSLMLLWRRPILSFATQIHGTINHLAMEFLFVKATPFFWLTFGAVTTLLSIPLFGPAVHLVAVSKIFRISFCRNGLSVSEVSPYNPDENDWRYWISWRQPRPLELVICDFKKYLQYAFQYKGTESHQIDKLKAKDRHRAMEPWFLWSRFEKDKENDPEMFTREPPSTWKARAMRNMKKRHRENYDAGNMSEDPLGIVLYRGFNVGLGLDHFIQAKRLKQGEGGSRALQVRAVEKAVKRYNYLKDAALADDRANKDTNPPVQELRNEERDNRIAMEIRYLAERMEELVPATYDEKIFSTDEKVYRFLGREMPQKYKRISNHEYRIVRGEEEDSSTDLLDPLAHTRPKRNQTVQVSPSVNAIFDSATDAQPGTDYDGREQSDGVDSDDDDDDDDHDVWEPTIVYA